MAPSARSVPRDVLARHHCLMPSRLASHERIRSRRAARNGRRGAVTWGLARGDSGPLRALILEADPEMTEGGSGGSRRIRWRGPGLVTTGSSAPGRRAKVVKLTFARGPGSQTRRASLIPAWRATREGRSTSTKARGRCARVQALVKAAVAQNDPPAKTVALPHQ